MSEKKICPYCNEPLENFADEPDKVARCSMDGDITCSLCMIGRHFPEKHPGFIQFGRLDNNGKFHPVDEWDWES